MLISLSFREYVVNMICIRFLMNGPVRFFSLLDPSNMVIIVLLNCLILKCGQTNKYVIIINLRLLSNMALFWVVLALVPSLRTFFLFFFNKWLHYSCFFYHFQVWRQPDVGKRSCLSWYFLSVCVCVCKCCTPSVLKRMSQNFQNMDVSRHVLVSRYIQI